MAKNHAQKKNTVVKNAEFRVKKAAKKLLCSSENFMFDFNLETLGFKRYIYFMLKIGNF